MAVVAMNQIVACSPTPRLTRISGAMFCRRSRRGAAISAGVGLIGQGSSEGAPVLAGLAAESLEADVAPQIRRQDAEVELAALAWRLLDAVLGEKQRVEQRQQAQWKSQRHGAPHPCSGHPS